MDDLDDLIRERLYLYFETGDPESEQQKATDALRAVLDWHKPRYAPEGMSFMGHGKGAALCEGCDCGDPYLSEEYPCPTVRAVARELGVSDE